ncbi:MAG: hypothetical protein NT007_02235 [Candidatus Kapabacteria bacterium]|nr:hypothetical protein [Candidatus Kapabacteria bacterium]
MKKYLLYLLVIMFTITVQTATKAEEMLKNCHSNAGNDFWFTLPAALYGESNFYHILVNVVSSTNNNCYLEIPGKGVFKSQALTPDETFTFELTPGDVIVNNRGSGTLPISEQVYAGAGVHIFSDSAIILYVTLYYTYMSDGIIVLPFQMLGTEYIVSSYPETTMYPSSHLSSESACIAVYDNTQVSFTLEGTSSTETSGGLTSGNKISRILNRGDIWMFSGKKNGDDLSGSMFSSSKPIAVVSGNYCANVPQDNKWCDYLCEMEIPTHLWGTDYFVGKLPMRRYPSIIRIYAKESGTKFYIDGNECGTMTKVPGVFNKGYFERRMVPMGQKPKSVVVSGSAPINVVLYNTGIEEEDPVNFPRLDPFQMNIVPYQGFMKDISFAVPNLNGKNPFSLSYLNLSYQVDKYGNAPDDLEIADFSNPYPSWTRINQKYPGIDEKYSVLVDGKQYAHKTIQLSGKGPFKLRAKNPLGAQYYGDVGDLSPVGYPAAYGNNLYNSSDLEKPVTSWSFNKDSICFINYTEDMPQNAALRSNLCCISLIDSLSYNMKLFTPNILPGITHALSWNLFVRDSNKYAKGSVYISDFNYNDTVLIFNYSPAKRLQASPSDNIYETYIGKNIDTSIIINNIGSTTFYVKNIFGNNSNYYQFAANRNIAYLNPNDTFSVSIHFIAKQIGKFNDSLLVYDDTTKLVTAYFNSLVHNRNIKISGKTQVCSYDSNNYSVTNFPNTTYQWELNNSKLNNKPNEYSLNLLMATFENQIHVFLQDTVKNFYDTVSLKVYSKSRPGANINVVFFDKRNVKSIFSTDFSTNVENYWSLSSGNFDSISVHKDTVFVCWDQSASDVKVTLIRRYKDGACEDSAFKTFQLKTSVYEMEIGQLSVSPNPISNQIHLSGKVPNQFYHLTIQDIFGTDIYSSDETITDNSLNLTIDATNFGNCIYFVILRSDDKNYFLKFIK